MKESNEDYDFGEVKLNEDRTNELLPEEKEFIKEYLAFTEYRKQKWADENS